ncbi:phosphonate C-P lyase system protein PhnG [Serratia sp. UGAL515B_01]|uniref:phosphonate C-P lyase system protein PhnG n=1 Tax=Serratia sp. UGAL515B_01 TaxID=2986763 RepID=UPI0029530B01|nr:phosphonate C-P lyase system protein PhnG [Serratia sp. UGAL515B_01]WON78280.1 phosphonate C-P lyase system protein PhnG [Serratia sp. UGAL515B_01]
MQTLQQRKRWMSVLAHSPPAQLREHWQALNLRPSYHCLRAPEIGLARLQGRMGATGRRFVLGDMTVTRAVVQLEKGGQGYSYISGRDKDHAELCALIDALLQQPSSHELLLQRLIEPLAALQQEQRRLRASSVAASRVDFFTLVRGD